MSLLIAVSVAGSGQAVARARSAGSRPQGSWPARVLLVNDDGIDSPGLVEMARAFAAVTETWVVAPLENKSGSGNYGTLFQPGNLKVEQRDLAAGIHAYAVDGFPADCVSLALYGLMRDAPPDLVVSGINTGPNLGGAWFVSGTVGAARVAALAGLPALAVSGFDQKDPAGLAQIIQWIVRLAASPMVRELSGGRLLSVNFPRSAARIQGVRIAPSAPFVYQPVFERADGDTSQVGRQAWKVAKLNIGSFRPEGTDVEAYRANFISITAMRADEQDPQLAAELESRLQQIPGWPSPSEPR